MLKKKLTLEAKHTEMTAFSNLENNQQSRFDNSQIFNTHKVIGFVMGIQTNAGTKRYVSYADRVVFPPSNQGCDRMVAHKHSKKIIVSSMISRIRSSRRGHLLTATKETRKEDE